MHQAPPIHVTAEHLLYFVYHDNLTLAPKADGIPIIQKIKDIEMETEYIKNLDLYLAFDLVDKSEPDIMTRMGVIKSRHALAHLFTPIEDIKELINRDNRLIAEYLQADNKLKWFPKTLFRNNLAKTQLLSFLDTEIEFPYPTDGWILTVSNERMGKYKPMRELTIDVQFHGKYCTSKEGMIIPVNFKKIDKVDKKLGIWRCVYDSENKIWVARDYRPEKKFVNNKNIIDVVESQVKTGWRAIDFINFVDTHPHFYYKPIKELDDETKEFLNKQREIMQDWLTPHLKGNILDIGCGRGKICKLTNEFVTGIDIDPISIHIARCKYPKQRWIWSDMKDLKLNDKYDMIIMNFSIQYVLPDLEEFLKKLIKLSHDKTIWYISFMEDDNNDFVEKKDGKLVIDFPWAEKHVEEILTLEMMKKEITKVAWNIKEYKPRIETTGKYEGLANCYRWIVCTRF